MKTQAKHLTIGTKVVLIQDIGVVGNTVGRRKGSEGVIVSEMGDGWAVKFGNDANPYGPLTEKQFAVKSSVRFAHVTRQDGEWVVVADAGNGQDDKVHTGFKNGRDALEWAIAQNLQTVYRGLTYNEGGTGPKAEPSRPTNTELLETFKASIDSDLKQCQRINEKFLKDFATNPHYALQWAAPAFGAAGVLKVASVVKDLVAKLEADGKDAGDILKTALEVSTREALRLAKYPARSTSVPSNEVAREEGAAWAHMVEKLDLFVR